MELTKREKQMVAEALEAAMNKEARRIRGLRVDYRKKHWAKLAELRAATDKIYNSPTAR